MFEIGSIVYSADTKEIFEVVEYKKEIEYNVYHSYVIRNLETDKTQECSLSYLDDYMTTYNKLEALILKNTKEIQMATDTISDARWKQEEIRYKLKQCGLQERMTKR